MPFPEEDIKKLIPYYELLCKEFSKGYVKFFPQVGAEYFNGNHKKIMIVGKACNGWVEAGKSNDIEMLFKDGSGIVNRQDQMDWVKAAWPRNIHDENGKKLYSTSRSAFWTFSRKFASTLLAHDLKLDNDLDYFDYIAWSNLYKVSPSKGGNPNQKDCNNQAEICTKIFKTELEILKPDFIFFFTSGWEFSPVWKRDVFGCLEDKTLKLTEWKDNKIISYKEKIEDNHTAVFIHAQHPQGKPSCYFDAINKVILDWKN